jgi:hypothetical protein
MQKAKNNDRSVTSSTNRFPTGTEILRNMV